MTKIITLHSSRRGTGKSTLTANLGAILAARGLRVGMADFDLTAPVLFNFFGVDEESIEHTLDGYLAGECDLLKTALDITPCLGSITPGRLYLITCSQKVSYEVRKLTENQSKSEIEALFSLGRDLHLDFLLLDLGAGVSEENLLKVAISDTVIETMLPDKKDYL